MQTNDTRPAEADGPGSAAITPGRKLPVATQGVLLAIGAALLVAVFFVLPAVIGHATTHDADAPQAADAPFRPTDQQWAGLKIERATVRTFQPTAATDGKIALDDDLTTPVFSPYSGRVTKVLARAGDMVAAGAPLLVLQANELSQAQNDLVSGVATLRTAHAQLDLATASERRLHELYLGHGAALKDWQQSRVDLATAQGALASAEIAVASVRNRLTIFGLSEGQIRAIENAPNYQRETAAAIVRAPIAGTITQRQVGPGQNIVGASASQGAAQAVFSIGDLSKVWLVANAREADAPLIHVGDPVQVDVLAFPGRLFAARITYVGASIDPATHRLPVRAEIANPERALKPEMFASFEIATGDGAASPAVPEEAVVYDGADAHVWVADPARHTLELRRVEIGRISRGQVEAISGLKAGESVVTSGSVFIDRAITGG